MAKSKKPVSHAIVGNTRKSKSSTSISKRAMLFALVGVLAFSVVAGIGWQKWQVHQLKAKAAGWTTVFNGGFTTIVACKTPVNSGYGPLWKVSLYFIGTASQVAGGGFQVLRGSANVSNVSVTVYPGQWIYRETYASRILGDTWTSSGGYGGRGAGSGIHSFEEITSC